MRHSPHGFQWSWIARLTRDEMPMNVRQLIPEEFVVDFLRLVDFRQGRGYAIHIFDQLRSLRLGQLEQFGRVTAEYQDGPTREKLIVVKIGLA